MSKISEAGKIITLAAVPALLQFLAWLELHDGPWWSDILAHVLMLGIGAGWVFIVGALMAINEFG